jgi:hypothetical protein
MGVNGLAFLAAGGLATLSVSTVAACRSSESTAATTGSDAASCQQGDVYCEACGGWLCAHGECPNVTCPDASAADATNADARICPANQVPCLDCSGAVFCMSGCPEMNCPIQDASTTDSAATGDGSTREASATDCGPDALTCNSGQVCLDHVYIGNDSLGPDGGPIPSTPRHNDSCVADPCVSDASSECYCQLLCYPFGDVCQFVERTLTCTTYLTCASSDTPIATANGDRPIASLRAGDLVYSADRQALRLVPLLWVSKTAVSHHHVIEITLANGSTLKMSAGHPTADGRLFGDLQAGDRLDGVTVLSRREIAYADSYTYDILPASDTHTYVAAGVLVGSTLGAAPLPRALFSP